MKTLLAALLMTIALDPNPAVAANSGSCRVVPRAQVSEWMREMPEEVLGWISCAKAYPQLEALTFARFENPTEKDLTDFLLRYARLMVRDEVETVIVGNTLGKDGRRQIMIRSKRNNGKFDWHYAFTGTVNGITFVFAHTDNQQATLIDEPTLQKVRLELTSAAFLAALAK